VGIEPIVGFKSDTKPKSWDSKTLSKKD